MRIVFLGSPADVIPPLQALLESEHEVVGVVSQPPRPVGRGHKTEDPPVAAFAKSKGLKLLQPERASEPAFLEQLRLWQPDVAVTAAYGQILSDEFLAIPRRATINIHPSKLPLLRGATPVQSALLRGFRSTAVSVLFTVRQLDAGAIINQKDFEIEEDETADRLTERLFRSSVDLLLESLEKLRDPSFVGSPQDEHHVSFCHKIAKADGELDFSARSHRLLRRYAAFQPWPGVHIHLGQERLNVRSLAISNVSAPCGQLRFQQGHLILGCGQQTSLSIGEVQKMGGKWMDAASFWNGLKDRENLLCQYQRRPSIVVCVSGTGRSLANLLQREGAKYKIAGVLCSHPQAKAIQLARDAGVSVEVLSDWDTKSVRRAIKSFSQPISLICLAGFLKKFPSLPEYHDRVINIHPALLPDFGGKGMYGTAVHRAVVAAGRKQSGATVHFVNDRYDEGQIIAQKVVDLQANDTEESLAERVFVAECELLPQTIEGLLSGDLPE